MHNNRQSNVSGKLFRCETVEEQMGYFTVADHYPVCVTDLVVDATWQQQEKCARTRCRRKEPPSVDSTWRHCSNIKSFTASMDSTWRHCSNIKSFTASVKAACSARGCNGQSHRWVQKFRPTVLLVSKRREINRQYAQWATKAACCQQSLQHSFLH